jgi:hypothetical protein
MRTEVTWRRFQRSVRFGTSLEGVAVKRFLKILVAAVIVVAVGFVCLPRIAPIALSYYAVKEAPPVVRVLPMELRDSSISQAPGKRFSYFGYEFEVPWSDLDKNQTEFYPVDKPATRAELHFRSGLKMLISFIPPREWAQELAEYSKVSPRQIESIFGNSDYEVVKTIYEFSTDKMHHWNTSPQIYGREQTLLILKSIAPSAAADSGIFNIRNQTFRGFQEGDPRFERHPILIHLFSDDGSIEFVLSKKPSPASATITQADINRIVYSLHKVSEDSPEASQIATRN